MPQNWSKKWSIKNHITAHRYQNNTFGWHINKGSIIGECSIVCTPDSHIWNCLSERKTINLIDYLFSFSSCCHLTIFTQIQINAQFFMTKHFVGNIKPQRSNKTMIHLKDCRQSLSPLFFIFPHVLSRQKK